MSTENVTDHAATHHPAFPQLAEVDAVLRTALASAGLFHDMGNHLNLVVLQAAVLQTRVPDALKESAGQISVEGVRAANVMQPVRQRNWPQQSVDVPATLTDALNHAAEHGRPARCQFSPNTPAIHGMGIAVHWFARFLHATLGARATGALTWATDAGPHGEMVLTVCFPGTAAAGDLAEPFEGETGLLAVPDQVDRAAARYWVRLHNAQLVARADGEQIELRVTIPVA